MKNITPLLRDSELTPYERVRLLILNDQEREKTGRDILSKSDIHALSQGWTATAEEAREYNRYLELIRTEHTMRIDMHLFALQAETTILRNQRLLDYFLAADQISKPITTITQEISDEKCLSFLTQVTYLEYDKVLHHCTFYNLPKKIQTDLSVIDTEIGYDHTYFDDEVFLFEKLNKQGEFSETAKQEIAEHLMERMYYEGLLQMKGGGTEKDCFLYHASFASLLMRTLFMKLATDNNLSIDDTEESVLNALEKFAHSSGVSLKEFIKKGIVDWLHQGLFTRDYTALCLSDNHKTWYGKTKQSHKKLFEIWYDERERAKAYIDQLKNEQYLRQESRNIDLFNRSKSIQVLTGDSLYKCTETSGFVLAYQTQVRELIEVARVFLFIQKQVCANKNYQTLLRFKALAQKVAAAFDVEVAHQYEQCIESYFGEVTLLNSSVSRLLDRVLVARFAQKDTACPLTLDDRCFRFKADDEAEIAHIVSMYTDEYKKLKLL
jgi:hypothetical protein